MPLQAFQRHELREAVSSALKVDWMLLVFLFVQICN
jgi:hypothetical protein